MGHPLVARKTDQLIRLSTGVLSTPPSPAVRNHRIAVRLALKAVSALHWVPQGKERYEIIPSKLAGILGIVPATR
jgi:hypothetical protein